MGENEHVAALLEEQRKDEARRAAELSGQGEKPARVRSVLGDALRAAHAIGLTNLSDGEVARGAALLDAKKTKKGDRTP